MSSSSSSSEDEDEQIANLGRGAKAFAGLELYSDSDESDSDGDDNDNISKQKKISPPVASNLSEDGSSTEDEGDDDSLKELDTQKDEMSKFDSLVGRTTRHGTTIQADFVAAVRQLVDAAASRPTKIQSECWTAMLSPPTRERDVICVSKTGSGKTLSFLVPLLAGLSSGVEPCDHHHPDFVYPRAVVLAPTRVLAQQIFEVASALVKNAGSLSEVRVSAALGGLAYHQQMTDLMGKKPHLVIATPGRLNSLCGRVAADTNTGSQDGDGKAAEMCIKLDDVREMVIDEADMMLAMGFKDDLSWFAQLVNDASDEGFRLVLTSATWDKETGDSLSQFDSISEEEPIFLETEHAGRSVTKNVTQRVEVLASKGAPRFNRLVKLITAALQENSLMSRVIVFCPHKSQTRQMGKDLRAKGIANVVLEGDMSQSARFAAIEAFRNGTQERRVLVATDVAARGLDVLGVSHVFNYSLGISIESYIHRCGRTGRAGRFGIAHTFVVKGDEKLSPELCKVLNQSNQKIPDDLRIMAGKEMKKRKKGTKPAVAKSEESLADAAELREIREENRKKQLLHNQQHQRGSKNGKSKRKGKR